MVEAWLEALMKGYNRVSIEQREGYMAQVHLPGEVFQSLVWWALQALPDEILVGLDVDEHRRHRPEVEAAFSGESVHDRLFEGQGHLIKEAHIVNRGDSYSVHHLPEEWTDGMFSANRGSRAGRFTHWLHTHPNAPAIPSGADADAAQWTEGTDMILGIRFSPEGYLSWFDEVDGVRRPLRDLDDSEALGRAKTGHLIHGLDLICFHRTGLGVNLVITDENGQPIE